MRISERNRMPRFPKATIKVRDILDEDTLSTYRTQAISDASERCKDTNVAVPSDRCVEESKDWVDENHK